MNRKLLVLLFVVVVSSTVGAAVVFWGDGSTVQASAMTELNVRNLSCGSCVNNIQQALAKVPGVGQVDVSVTTGRGQITYDPAVISSQEIAKVVSDAGYLAVVRLDLNVDEYKNLQSDTEQLSASFVARIGSRLLSRDDFNQAVQLRSGVEMAGAKVYADQQLRSQVWKELKEREILLAAADLNQIVVQDGEVNLEIDRIKSAIKDFETTINARFGSYNRFFAQVKENLIINKNIEQNVIAGITNDRDKQIRFSQWYNETLQNTDVVIFDPAIKQSEAAGSSSCGGSCGGSNS